MIQKKYIASLAILILFTTSFVNANETGGSNGYKTPITTNKFQFTANLDDAKVNMTWKRFDSFSTESLTYYKVIRSSTNSNPVYPDDGYIKYDTDMGFTSYTDSEVKEGINYYRVCAITSKLNRYCSNVVKIEYKASSTETTSMANPASVNCVKLGGTLVIKDESNGQVGYCKFSNGQVCEEWKLFRSECKITKEEKKENKQDNALNKKVEILISSFEKKLEEKFGTDTEKKIVVINTAITRLEALKIAKPSKSTIIDLVIEKLKSLLTKTDTQDIENILEL